MLSAATLLGWAFFLRLPGFFHNSLHSDEALFATWARLIATGRDPLLAEALIDKPPLLFYAQAGFLRMFGYADFALRMPNLIAGVLLVALSYRLTDSFSGRNWAGGIAALLLAISPMMVQFSAAAFTDMLMLLAVVAACLAMLHGRPIGAGLLLALAVGVKLQALLLLPLMLLFANFRVAKLRKSMFSLGIGLVVLLCWFFVTQDFGRWLTTGDASLLRTLRPISSFELLPRIEIWHQHLSALLGVDALVLTLVALGGAILLRHDIAKLLLAIALAYFGLHWLFATATHDRYMLPFGWLLIIVLALLGGEVMARVSAELPQATKKVLSPSVLLLLFIVTLPLANRSRSGTYAVGGQISAENGTQQLAQQFANAPYGTVLYDHWYSWQARYRLFDSRVHVEWVPYPAQLVADLNIFFDDNRFIILPGDNRATPYRRALSEAGYRLETQLQSDLGGTNRAAIIYQITR